MAPEHTKGFVISLDPVHRIVRSKAWGCWHAEFVQKYENAFLEKIEEVCDSVEDWHVLMNVQEFSPASAEVQRVVHQLLMVAQQMGMRKLACLGDQDTIQLLAGEHFSARDSHRYLWAASEQEAVHWLMGK